MVQPSTQWLASIQLVVLVTMSIVCNGQIDKSESVTLLNNPSDSLDKDLQKQAEEVIKENSDCVMIRETGIYSYLDKMSGKFLELFEKKGDQYQDEIASAIHVRRLVKKSSQRINFPIRGLGVLLYEEPINPHLVRRENKLAYNSLEDLALLSWQHPVLGDKEFKKRMFQQIELRASKELDGQSGPKKNLLIREAKKFILTMMNLIVKLSDQLYTNPIFTENLPFIGILIRQMKEKGKPMYEILKFLKGTIAEHKSDGAQKMISDVGISALVLVTTKLAANSLLGRLEGGSVSLIVRRLAYLLLAYLADRFSECRT